MEPVRRTGQRGAMEKTEMRPVTGHPASMPCRATPVSRKRAAEGCPSRRRSSNPWSSEPPAWTALSAAPATMDCAYAIACVASRPCGMRGPGPCRSSCPAPSHPMARAGAMACADPSNCATALGSDLRADGQAGGGFGADDGWGACVDSTNESLRGREHHRQRPHRPEAAQLADRVSNGVVGDLSTAQTLA